MKYLKFLLASFFVMFLTSCEVGVLPTDDIGLPAAFAHCAGSVSYWVWGVLCTLVVAFIGYKMYLSYTREGKFTPLLAFILLAGLLFVWMYRPSELAWNTTVEQAAKGIWIGY